MPFSKGKGVKENKQDLKLPQLYFWQKSTKCIHYPIADFALGFHVILHSVQDISRIKFLVLFRFEADRLHPSFHCL